MSLYKHQQDLIDLNPKKHLIHWECGTGKTLTAIKLVDKNKVEALVICPKSLKQNWKEEIDKWSDDPLKFTIMSKEEFRRDAPKLRKFNAVVIDECHFMASFSPKSKMFKNTLAYMKKHEPEYRWLMTGTGYLRTPWNVYAYAQILGLYWHYMKFKVKFFDDVRMGQRVVSLPKKNIQKDVAKLVQSIGSTVKMSDAVDVPDSVFIKEYFDLNTEQKKKIKEIDDVDHIVRWTKIHQICGGTLKGDEYTPNQSFACEKRTRLKELLQEHRRAAVICRYNHEIDVLAEELRDTNNIYIIRGGVKDRHEVVNNINNSDECIVLINAACSEGYNLPSIPVMIFYSYGFSLKDYIQVKSRIQRINKVQKCVYISLLTRNQVDEDVYKSVVINKQDFHMEIYKGPQV